MADDSPPVPPPSGLRKWLQRLGCAFLLLSLTCAGLFCAGGWWLDRSARAMNKDDVDRLRAEGLRDGNVKAIYERADESFRKRYALKDLQAFLDDRPGLVARENRDGMYFTKKTIDGIDYVTLKSKPSRFAIDEWEIVCRIVDGALVLVGISPGLDDPVPSAFRHRSRTSRHHH